LGRTQAHLTGVRIAEMVKGAEDTFGPCHIKALRVSNLTRAKETAEIIAAYLPGVPVEEPDPMLNEGRPCHTIPGGTMSDKDIALTDAHHPRIEGAFQKYLYRSSLALPEKEPHDDDPSEHHEFEVIICHANVIRYIMCRYVLHFMSTLFPMNIFSHICCFVFPNRALQLPPEAWLRFCPFNCSLTYLTVRPTGTVSCRMLGDIGHLPYNASTFSGHHGYNW
jgi:serine/threonine-protein phosphatase PGAM5